MFCNQCGTKNPDGSKFCNNCGAKMVPVEKKEPPEFYATADKLAHFNQDSSPIPNMPVSKGTESKPVEPKNEEKPISAEVVQPEEVVARPTVEDDDPLARLSTFREKTEVKKIKKEASAEINPIEDEYWNDTLDEIESEIYMIPKENIIKIAGSLVALLAVIAWLIYML